MRFFLLIAGGNTIIQTEIQPDVLAAIGTTPLIRLNRIASPGGATILAKAEFMNPGDSIKDRIARYIIEDAEARGLLRPGGVIVENTSGNTGAALAMVAAVKGYRAIFTIPDKMSREKVGLLRAFGAEVIITPTDLPPDSPQSYCETAKRIARETPGSFYVDQYFNPKNIDSHYYSTGPEIWEQTGGKIDFIVAGAGTGGTISGVARYLKERDPKVKAIAVDPVGSVFYDYFKYGRVSEPARYELEGIGEDMPVDNFDVEVIDDVVRVDDASAFRYALRLCREEGLFVGGSGGAAAAAAVRLSEELGTDSVIVIILPDSGSRYLSKFYNEDWMARNGFIATRKEAEVSL